MPQFICPRCGKTYFVPLAICECFLDVLPAVRPRGAHDSFFVTRCEGCISSNPNQETKSQRYQVGDAVGLVREIGLLADSSGHDTVAEGSVGVISEVIESDAVDCIYVVRFGTDTETCAVSNWMDAIRDDRSTEPDKKT